MKFLSWNIDSLNAALTGTSARSELSRAVLRTLQEEQADFIAIQETKLPEAGPGKKHKEGLLQYFPDYHYDWVSSCQPARKGYAGCMLLYRKDYEPVITHPVIGAPEPMDCEGRIITAEMDDFYFTLVYTPNAGDGLRRLEERQVWDKRFQEYIAQLDRKKPVILCGDFNVAVEAIDLAHPESNHRSPGFTDEERTGFRALLAGGMTDTFRHVHGPVEGQYTWWAQRVRTSKVNNSGWRIDYFLVSDRLGDRILRSDMVNSGSRQDHTPILLEIQ